MSIKNRQHVDPCSYQLISKIVLSCKNYEFGDSRDHNPYHKLNKPNFIIDMFVQIFIAIPINVLCIMYRKINAGLQHQDIIFLSLVDYNAMDHVADEYRKKDLAQEVYEVPVAPISLVHF